MLKLEKVAKTLEISITLRKRERIFNGALLRALGYATLIHIVAGVLFHVSPFIITGSQTLIAPIVVDADLTLNTDANVTAQIENEENFPRSIREPKGSKFALPVLHPTPLQNLPTQLLAFESSTDNPFEKKERELLRNTVVEHSFTHLPVEVFISGPLAGATLLTTAFEAPASSPTEPCKAVFAVRLDEKTGTLFWFESLNPLSPSFEQQAEKIVRQLRFAGNASSPTGAGIVEIHFYPKV